MMKIMMVVLFPVMLYSAPSGLTLYICTSSFIGIIESDADPAPDRLLISDVTEFHNFISKSNNYAWRNCNIEELLPEVELRIKGRPDANLDEDKTEGPRDEICIT